MRGRRLKGNGKGVLGAPSRLARPSRFPRFQNPLSFPFQTPATQDIPWVPEVFSRVREFELNLIHSVIELRGRIARVIFCTWLRILIASTQTFLGVRHAFLLHAWRTPKNVCVGGYGTWRVRMNRHPMNKDFAKSCWKDTENIFFLWSASPKVPSAPILMKTNLNSCASKSRRSTSFYSESFRNWISRMTCIKHYLTACWQLVSKFSQWELPQSRSLFSASFQTFCLTARAYLSTQKYGLFCSLLVRRFK